MPNSAQIKMPQAPKEVHRAGSPKKKTVNSLNSKDGESKKSKKRKTPTSKAGKSIHDPSDVELYEDAHAKAPLQQIQVKPKSTGNTPVLVPDNTTSESGVIDETGGFASGQFGTLLQTKRGEQLCISLGLQKRHVEALHRAFKREEQLGTGEITTAEFFTMLHEQPRQLTKGMFEAVGLVRNIKRLRFDDFVICVTTISIWSKSELLRYAFKQFDVDDSGVMDSRELRAFCEGLKNDSSFYFAKNVNTAREKLAARDHTNLKNQGSSQKIQLKNDVEDDALVDLEDLVKGSTEFQVAFYPLMQFQQNIRACALGEQFWSGVTIRCQHVELIVHYMELHKGKLPPISLVASILAVIPFSQAHKKVLVHKLAVLRYAEVQRQLHDQAKVKQNLRLTHVEEEK